MSNDDTKVINLTERRKRDLPAAPTCLRDVHDIILDLIGTLEANGQKRLVGTYIGGWSFKVERSDDNGSSEPR